MRYGYYNAQSLRKELNAFEARYGIKTEEFVELRRTDEIPEDMPRFDASVWASMHQELRDIESS